VAQGGGPKFKPHHHQKKKKKKKKYSILQFLSLWHSEFYTVENEESQNVSKQGQIA
jgi:hypothetical protein